MQATELQELFGAPVLVQFREPVALATSSGEPEQYIPMGPLGSPSFRADEKGFRPVGALRRRATVQRDSEGAVFSLTIEGMILPCTDPERVQVCYDVGERSVTMYVRPGDILAVSLISDKPTQGLIQRA